ncbi:unnamed protein product, partial [Discosporangium mesarthrocarpum]
VRDRDLKKHKKEKKHHHHHHHHSSGRNESSGDGLGEGGRHTVVGSEGNSGDFGESSQGWGSDGAHGGGRLRRSRSRSRSRSWGDVGGGNQGGRNKSPAQWLNRGRGKEDGWEGGGLGRGDSR